MLSPSNTSPALTSDLAGNANFDYFPGYYRVSNNDLYQATTVARFVYEELGLRAMATVDDGDPYPRAGQCLYQGLRELAAVSPQSLEQGRPTCVTPLAEITEVYADDDQPVVLQGIFLRSLSRGYSSPSKSRAREFQAHPYRGAALSYFFLRPFGIPRRVIPALPARHQT